MQCLGRERGELEFDPASDRQPVQFPQNGCDVFTTICQRYQSACCTLYRLQSLIQHIVIQYRVAVVQTTGDERLNQRLYSILRQ